MANFGVLTTPYVQLPPEAPGISSIIVNALVAEGSRMEPVIGQIWPR